MIRKFAGHDVDTPPGTVTWSDCPTEVLTTSTEVCYTISMEEKETLLKLLSWAYVVHPPLLPDEEALLDRLKKL